MILNSDLYMGLYIYNSVCARRHKYINSSVSAPLTSVKIAVIMGIYWRARIFIFQLELFFLKDDVY